MPDWNKNRYKELKELIITYTKSLNGQDYETLMDLFHGNAVMHRAMKNYTNKDNIVEWFKNILEPRNYKFRLVDATAAILPDDTARCILWFEISRKINQTTTKDVHIETFDLVHQDNTWKIKTCFGLGFDPKHHEEFFMDISGGR